MLPSTSRIREVAQNVATAVVMAAQKALFDAFRWFQAS